MDSPPPSTSSDAPRPTQPEAESKREEREKEMLHKTKAIQFFGRTTPIILQNDNGPCPLLAICNVLSLKNSLNLSPDIPEVSQEKLLSLVAERLIDSNSNIDNKDAGYVENQQQNIADAIDLLPRLTTGIDVNIKFRRIEDFEFTPECAIFDLLDIPLYHGWIVDPQDSETADAIGSKSYNTLMGELVSLETQAMESEQNMNIEEDDVDFVAATTAALGVPSPSLSRGQSFTESPQRVKKGDMEEVDNLFRVLKLSEAERPSSTADGIVADVESAHTGKYEMLIHSDMVETNIADETINTGALVSDDTCTFSNPVIDTKAGALLSDDSNGLNNLNVNYIPGIFTQEGAISIPKTDKENCVQDTHKESKSSSEIAVKNTGCDPQILNEKPLSSEEVSPSNNFLDKSRSDEHAENKFTSTSDLSEERNLPNDCTTEDSLSLSSADLESSSGRLRNNDKPEVLTSSIDVSEPIYEGEECIMESGSAVYENQEPIYEGEVVLAEQVNGGCAIDCDTKDRISATQGELVRKFMKDSASQLTVYGLFCLQDKVKERELCVFFRNNHFNTMFKYEGELYILATDQGYINQPDLVWEKLNEVNGDTVYVMGNFKEFKVDNHSNDTWDEQNAMARTADYLSSIDGATQSGSSINPDLQLAIALQQQEFEQQQPQRNLPQTTISGGSGLVTGPQGSHSGGRYGVSSPTKQDSKLKEKCIVM